MKSFNNSAGRVAYLVTGLIFLVFGFFLLLTGSFSVEILVLFSMAIMTFCMSYLYPQLKNKNARSAQIRRKGFSASFIFTIAYLVLFLILVQIDDGIDLNAYQIISIILSLSISTLFISFLISSFTIDNTND
ncbi:permease [Bacillus sp. C1-1]|nr:permease [Bacillus sp. C1-1]